MGGAGYQWCRSGSWLGCQYETNHSRLHYRKSSFILELNCFSWFLWWSNTFISISRRLWTHSMMPRWETSSPKRCSTQAVEERMKTTWWSDGLVSLLSYVVACIIAGFDTFASLCYCWIMEIFCNCACFGVSAIGEAAKTCIIYKKFLKYDRWFKFIGEPTSIRPT
jgi:hypothetical protein